MDSRKTGEASNTQPAGHAVGKGVHSLIKRMLSAHELADIWNKSFAIGSKRDAGLASVKQKASGLAFHGSHGVAYA